MNTKLWKKCLGAGIALAMLLSCAMPVSAAGVTETEIELSDSGITVDGALLKEGDESGSVTLAHDIIYYEDRDTYDSGNVYGEGTAKDKHTQEEADSHTVVHITQAGTYRISGTLSAGQIAVDLGKGAKQDPEAVVTLILDNADITCTVAPALIFYNVYECDTAWVSYDEGDTEEYTASIVQDTSAAGANVILADGSVNTVTGSHVAKIYKDNDQQKKLYKYDGAFYSRMSMNIDGESAGTGVLNVFADNEGMDSELHLSFNGGKVNIQSADDGINTNEDNVSVTTINGGALHIVAGVGTEGDGIDSNGYLVINGGVVISAASPISDSGLDSDCGSFVNGGTVIATGSTMDWAESDSDQVTLNLQFAASQAADEAIIITDTNGKVVFAYDPDKDETTGSYNRGYQGAVISSPALEVGQSYYVYVGGDVTGTDVDGLYDAATVTAFSGAVRQEYTGTDVRGFGPGGPGGPGGPMGGVTDNGDGTITVSQENAESMISMMKQFDPDTAVTVEQLTACTTFDELMSLIGPGDPGEMPDGPRPGNNGNGQSNNGNGQGNNGNGQSANGNGQGANGNGQNNNGNAPGNNGNGRPGNGNESGQQQESMEPSVLFLMQDKVNAFSGVCDEGTSASSDNGNSNGNGKKSDTGFDDVDDSAYYHDAIKWAVDKKVTNGTSASSFSPSQVCTRAQVVTFLWNAYGCPEPETTENPFTDISEDAYYYKAALWAYENGITTGVRANTFAPDKTCTRGQVATFLWRASGSPQAERNTAFTDVEDNSYYDLAVAWAAANGITQGTTDTTFSPDSKCNRGQIVTLLFRAMSE